MNFMKICAILVSVVAFAGCFTGQVTVVSEPEGIFIIPEPVNLEKSDGVFILNNNTKIIVTDETKELGKDLAAVLEPATGYTLNVKDSKKSTRNTIELRISPKSASLGAEGYRLVVTKKQVSIESANCAGIFYGIQSLRQLLPVEIFAQDKVDDIKWHIPCVSIEDTPRFKWRGLHLDVGRHYMPVEFIKKYIDLLAMHKMNTFHWHLTEDQGWRFESKKYPKLSEISAWRKGTGIGHSRDKPATYDGKRYGGFYTQDEMREVVAYASAQHITVVPEIEMPGHTVAVLAAYPELSCIEGPFEVRMNWGVAKNIFCAGNDKTFEFLEDILDEVLDIFPSEFIHIGGDEAPKDNWSKCEKCQKRIKDEGLSDEHELQSWFVKRIEKFLSSKGRRLIGWDEILEGGLAPGATVMSWRGQAGGITAAKSGHDVVMAPNSHTYFDHYQGKGDDEPLAIGGFLPLEKVYSYNPVPAVLNDDQKKHVLGVQAQLWTEYIATPEHAEYMAYPRACALSEVAWSPLEKKDYADFHKRLVEHTKRLDWLDVNYRKLNTLKVATGVWKSGQTSETFQPMEWEVTNAFSKAGDYKIVFAFTSGIHRLDIKDVEILANGKVVGSDRHLGIAGGRSENNIYNITLDKYDKLAKYILRANVRSDGGMDSNGVIYITKK